MGASPAYPLRPAEVAVDISPAPSMSSSASDSTENDVYFQMVRRHHVKLVYVCACLRTRRCQCLMPSSHHAGCLT